MELVYLWIDEYKNIKKQGFNFSPRYRCHYDYKENLLTIEKNKDYRLGNFFGNHINLTAIVGENGSGKTGILESLWQTITKKNRYTLLVIYFENEFYIFSYKREIKEHDTSLSYVDSPRFYHIDIENNTDKEYILLNNEGELEKVKEKLSLASYDGISVFKRYNFPLDTRGMLDPINLELDSLKTFISNEISFYLIPMQIEVYKFLLDLKNLEEDIFEKIKMDTLNFKVILPPRHFFYNLFFLEIENLGFKDVFEEFEKCKVLFEKENLSNDDIKNIFLKLLNCYLIFFYLKMKKDYQSQLEGAIIVEELEKDLLEKWELKINDEEMFKYLIDGFNFMNYVTNEGDNGIKDKEKLDKVKEKLEKTFDKLREFFRYIKNNYDKLKFKIKKEPIPFWYSREGDRTYSFDLEVSIKDENKYKIVYENILKKLNQINHVDNKFFKFLKNFFFYGFMNSKTGVRFSELSDGEKQIIRILVEIIYFFLKSKGDNLIVLLDEPDNSLHPQWKKEFIYDLVTVSEKILKELNKKVHFVITTHSPFLLSDIPKDYVVFLKKDGKGNCEVVDGLNEKKQTFAANIHTLLSDSFFLQDGLIGKFAEDKIKTAINKLNQEKLSKEDIAYCEKIIQILGEPIIRRQFQRMLDSKRLKKVDKIDELKNRIENLEKELKRLKNEKN